MVELLDEYGVLHIGTTDFLFDAEDIELINSRDWYCDKDGYLVSCYFFNGQRRFVRFHRIVMNAKPTQFVDHRNKNRADNRKENLRCCSRTENARNRGLQSTNKSGVAGVYFDKERSRWAANIIVNGKRKFLGRFETKEGAVMARLSKEVELFGEFSPQRELYERLSEKAQCNQM